VVEDETTTIATDEEPIAPTIPVEPPYEADLTFAGRANLDDGVDEGGRSVRPHDGCAGGTVRDASLPGSVEHAIDQGPRPADLGG
jgi:hypothetical protein